MIRRPAGKQPGLGRSASGGSPTRPFLVGVGGSNEPPGGTAGGDYAILPGDDDLETTPVERGERAGAGASALLLDSAGSEAGAASQDWRLNVFREFLCVGRLPHVPRYYEARPTHFPPDVTVFHTGALYVATHRAMAGFSAKYNQAYLGLFMALLFLYLVVFFNTPVLFETTGAGDRHFRLAAYACHAVAMYVVSATFAFFFTRPLVKKFHDKMDAVVQEMSPLFRRAGYDLEYHRRSSEAAGEPAARWSRLGRSCDRQSFVRIVPCSGNLTPDDEARADALWDPRRRLSGGLTEASMGREDEAQAFAATTATATATAPSGGDGFRVAVCGAMAYPGQAGHGRDPNFLYLSWLDKLGAKVDELTWGAVATEMRSFTDRYFRAHQHSVFLGVALCQLPIFVTDAFESWFVTAPYIVVMVFLFAAMYYPSALEVWWLKRAFGVPDLDEMRATVQRLSPLVEERSGYELRLETEPEGRWGGRSTYVYFESPRDPRAGSAMSPSSSMA